MSPRPSVRSSACFAVLALAALGACSAPRDPEPAQRSPAERVQADRAATPASLPPIGGVQPVDQLIEPGETHFAHLWQVTRGVENAAEGYWSFAGDRLTYQATPRGGGGCDRIFLTPRGGSSSPELVSQAGGITTCSYFLPGDSAVLYASTHAFQSDCPPKPDMSQGYVWIVHPEYDIYVHDLASGAERALTSTFGYDAEATISPRGDRIVFTSTRSGDLELWTCDLDGGRLAQVTHTPGYDGGAFFSHDGASLVFRSTLFTPGKEDEEIAGYRKLLSQWKVRPTRMEIMLIRPDGSGRRQLTNLGKANFAPYFFPDDRRVIFASNHKDPSRSARNFDLFAIGVDGKGLEQITFYGAFDAFPMFSPDGRWLAFASNRGGTTPEETNLFVAEWR
jgi:TolB protein